MIEAIFWVIVVFAVIVMIHEGGHFFFARLFDLEVEEFCIGIGPKIWGKKIGETFYGICAFPIGGFVKIAGMDPSEPQTERSFNTQSAWRRFWVIMGGPLFNFILAILLVFSLGFFGYPKNKIWVGEVRPGGPAEIAGIRAFDIVSKINETPIDNVATLQNFVAKSNGSPLRVTLDRHGEPVVLSVTPEVISDFNNGRPSLGVSLARSPVLKNVVSSVLPNTPAYAAGFKVGDAISAIGGEQVVDGMEAMEKIDRLGRTSTTPPEQNPESILIPVRIDFIRDGTPMSIDVKPEFNAQIGNNIAFIGVAFEPVLVKLPFIEASKTTWEYLQDLFGSLSSGLRAAVSAPSKSIVGPIGIADMIAQSAKSGFYQLVIISILLNINLGIINLFPLPALDGGRLVFILMEGVLRVKVSEHKEAMVHLVGFIMLMCLIFFVIFREVYIKIGQSTTFW